VEEGWLVVARDVLDVPQARLADFGPFGVTAEPAGAGQVWSAGEAGEQRDAVALEVAAVGSAGNAEPQEWHGPDVAADLAFDVGFLAGALAGRPAPVKPGGEQVVPQVVLPVVAEDEGGTDMPAEYRRAVVTAARVAAVQLPAVLPESAPQCGLAGLYQRVGADAHYPRAAVCAVLVVFVEKVEALRWAAGSAGALTQAPWPARSGGQLIQNPVELIGVCLAAAACGGRAARSGWGMLPDRLPSVLGGAGLGWLPGPGTGRPSGRG
jgi:hypothetical protein